MIGLKSIYSVLSYNDGKYFFCCYLGFLLFSSHLKLCFIGTIDVAQKRRLFRRFKKSSSKQSVDVPSRKSPAKLFSNVLRKRNEVKLRRNQTINYDDMSPSILRKYRHLEDNGESFLRQTQSCAEVLSKLDSRSVSVESLHPDGSDSNSTKRNCLIFESSSKSQEVICKLDEKLKCPESTSEFNDGVPSLHKRSNSLDSLKLTTERLSSIDNDNNSLKCDTDGCMNDAENGKISFRDENKSTCSKTSSSLLDKVDQNGVSKARSSDSINYVPIATFLRTLNSPITTEEISRCRNFFLSCPNTDHQITSCLNKTKSKSTGSLVSPSGKTKTKRYLHQFLAKTKQAITSSAALNGVQDYRVSFVVLIFDLNL